MSTSTASALQAASGPDRRGLWASLVFLALVGVVVVLTLRGGEKEGIEVRVSTSDHRSITSKVLAQGKVRAKRQVDVAPEIAGRVIEVFVNVGDQVTEGDPLFSLDDEQYQNAVSQIRVALDAADASVQRMQLLLKEAERNLARDQNLVAKGIGNQEQVRAQEARVAMARTDVRQAQAQRERARLDLLRSKESLRDTRVNAPLSGTVVAVGLEVGQVVGAVASGISGLGGGSPLAPSSSTPHVVIADLSQLRAMLDVDELDVARLQVGQQVELRAQGAIDVPYFGVVEEVGLLGQDLGGAVSFGVKVRIMPAGAVKGVLPSDVEPLQRFGLLRPGMSVSAEVQVERLPKVVAVPVAAILEGSGDKGDRVFVVDNGVAKEKSIELGPSEGDLVAVLSGLDAGEKVVEGPFRALRALQDADVVTIDETVDLPPSSKALPKPAALSASVDAGVDGAPTDKNTDAKDKSKGRKGQTP